MNNTVWSIFVDIGLVSILLLLGQWMRSRIVIFQKLLLPASMIAGFLGLILGPNGFEWLPFSDFIVSYPGILIAFIFASLPFSSKDFVLKTGGRRAGEIGTYSSIAVLWQWGLGTLFALAVLSFIWPELHPGFGTLLAAGFVGGHGTAAAIGSTFMDRGWDEAQSLAMISATVGILCSIVGGMLWIRWGSQKGVTNFITPFKDLPDELRTGLIPENKRESVGSETVSPLAIDPIIFHFAIIASAAVIGYYIGIWSSDLMSDYRIPTFSLAFLVAILLKWGLKTFRGYQYIDQKISLRLCGSFTDLLVVFGITSIQIPLLIKYAFPLFGLFIVGILICWALFFYLGPIVFRENWFEKSLYTWGWVTGIMAIAIALLRIVDAKNKANILSDFAVAYFAIGPLEVLLVTLAPVLIMNGYQWGFSIVTLGAGILLLLIILFLKMRMAAECNPQDPGKPHQITDIRSE